MSLSDLTSFRCIIEAEQGESKLVVRSTTVIDQMDLAEMAVAFGEFSPITNQFSAIAHSVRMAHNKRLQDEYGPADEPACDTITKAAQPEYCDRSWHDGDCCEGSRRDYAACDTKAAQ